MEGFCCFTNMELNTKKALREHYKSLRVTLSAAQEKNLNEQLLSQFQQFKWEGLGYVHIFLPIKKFKEPDTILLENWLRVSYPQIQLVISRSDLKTNMMDHYLWEKEHLLELNKWGIHEPKGGEAILPDQLDAVIIPLLAFDKAGNRVGYGKGFYDRFLSACRPDCLKIGLSFFEPVPEIKDTEPADIPLDYCITCEQIWNFKR